MGKRTFEIRLRATVEEDSPEAMLMEFLQDEQARPYSKNEMLMIAAKVCWLPLACQHQTNSHTKAVQLLYDAEYRWQLHSLYLRTKLGVGSLRIINNANSHQQQKEASILVEASTTTTAQNHELEIESQQVIDDLSLELDSPLEPFNPFGNSIISK
ncbi:hypothetical protein [Calothrix sp. NIES-2098]|uniref:hypothetical protein n=1 Tax=Calothrix sp. NIES-2098 TaxID=1954171 RepID=UPI000B5FFE80|nr:hypothetical protein NIES2098_72760 [Calothrix sp. NIES-2098]